MPENRPGVVVIDVGLSWQVAQDPDSGEWVGVCEPLNLNAVGETWEDFQEAAREVIAMLFDDLYEEGDLEEFLRSRGWAPEGEVVPGMKPRFDVPVEIHRIDPRQLAHA